MFKAIRFLLGMGCVVVLNTPSLSFATSIDWKGQYRFEYFDLAALDLDSDGSKSAFLHRFNLRPHVLVADGLRVIGSFELLTSSLYPNDQTGSWLGESSLTNQVNHQNMPAKSLAVRELYLRWEQEHAELTVGRAPLEFGMGAAYSAGTGAFDHFSNNQDMFGYKIFIGNLYIQPIFSRIQDPTVKAGEMATDQIWKLLYDNKDARAQFGVLRRSRNAPKSLNTAADVFDTAINPSYTSTAASGDWNTLHNHLYFSRQWEEFNFRLEGGFDSGDTGLVTSGGETIELAGYGVTIEMDYLPKSGMWSYKFLTGMVSGDDPTTGKYEGYQLNRNYDIGFLLGNYPLGKFDALTSNRQRSRDGSGNLRANSEVLDEEAVGNMMYFAPSFNRQISDRWTWTNRLVLAQMQVNNTVSGATDVSKDLGMEYDLGFVYRPHDRFTWVTEIGVLSPGAAFKEGSVAHDTKLTYGWQTKASVEF